MKTLFKLVLHTVLLAGATPVLAQVPIYNSNPSAQAVIFLDFDGHTVEGTFWNSSGPIYCGPSNLGPDQIAETFNRIAEDYRPFNVNITTDSTKYWSAPAKQRMRVIFTITSSWYGSGAGGVAYTGSFSWGNNTPCFVFTALHNYNVKNISEAGAHEAGHTLGLRHQALYDANCNLVSSYNYGTGTGDISWAPIMGVGYGRNVTTWYNGPIPSGCSNVQPDLDVITSATNGFGFRPDDVADSFSGAETVAFVNGTLQKTGMITTSADKDMYKVSLSSTKRVKLNALPASAGTGVSGSNLNLAVSLYDQSKKLIKEYNDEETLSVAVDTTLSAGSYYLQIDAVGSKYFSDYGSLGMYTLQAEEISLAVLPVSRFELKGMLQNGYHKLNWLLETDESVNLQSLEVSSNGRDFKKLADVESGVRSFSYHPETGGVVYYRIAMTSHNGRQYFSNVIAMRSADNSGRPKLISNVISSNALMVTSPAVYSYTINDLNGKVVAKGRVTQGSSTINTNYLLSGTYMIRFVNGSDQYVEKFLKH